MTAHERWAEYARTVVELAGPDGTTLRITPAPPGDVGEWPAAFTPPVLILTAWDPGEARPGDAENRRRQAALEDDIAAIGIVMWRAIGHDLDSGHREEGVAVTGLSESDALELARRYGQDAIFRWTPEAWSIVSCVDDARHDAGWRCGPAR